MLRINLLVAVAVAAGVVGCAQCDTCDDFPAPCTGPNCGQGYGANGMPAAMADPANTQGGPVMAPTAPASPAGDGAGPAPAAPAESATPAAPATPPAGSGATPPAPMDPFSQPK